MQLATEPGSAAGTPPAPDPVVVPAAGAWHESLPEHYEIKDDKGQPVKLALRGNPTLARYKTGEEAARALIEQHKALSAGGGGLKVPATDAKPEEWRAFWDKLGSPKDTTGYAEVRGGAGIDPKGLTAFFENVAVREGLTVRQVQASVNFMAEWQAQQRQALIADWVNRQEGLRDEWGANYTREVDLAKRGITYALNAAVSDPAERGELTALLTSVHEHPGFVRLAAWMGRNLAEDGIVPGHSDGAFSHAELDTKISGLAAQVAKLSRSDPTYGSVFAAYEAALRARHGTAEIGATAPK